jgi:hypothetical protein
MTAKLDVVTASSARVWSATNSVRGYIPESSPARADVGCR